MNNHKFKKESGPIGKYLIRNYEIASVEYPEDEKVGDNKWPLPIGLEKHDVYIIKQSEIDALNGKAQK